MKKNVWRAICVSLLICCLSGCGKTYEYPFRNPQLPVEERIDNLLELLTPEEKIGLMMNASQAVPRLDIPAYDWWNEALHGVARSGLATVFPQAIGMAATWNETEHFNTFDIISDEARAKYNEALREDNRGRYYGLSFWTPNINIFRDPRWGRGQETYGEDPYLTTRLGVAAVKGLQGNDPRYFKTHACAKHYAVHSGPEWNRHSYNAVVSDRDLWETYLPAFKALVQEANVQEVMCAYNAFNGQPCCGSNELLTDILRNQWKYNGIIVTDCWAMNDFFNKGAHETHPDPTTAVADAVIHSTDLECGDSYKYLNEALKDGLLTIEQIDSSLRRVLRGWIELGMFDPQEMVPWSNYPYSMVDSQKHREQALKVAHESMTLLKNNSVLPLHKDIKRIAVIGPNAADSTMLWGNYSGFPSSTVTILDGIKAKLPNTEVIYEKGCELVDPWVRTSLYSNFLSEASGSQGMKVEFFNNNSLEGQPAATLVNSVGVNYNSSGGTALAQGVNMENTSTRISGIFVAPYTGEIEIAVEASEKCEVYLNNKQILSQNRKAAPLVHMANVQKGQKYEIKLEQAQSKRNVEISLNINQRTPIEFSALVEKVKDADAIIYAGGLSPRLEGEEMPVNAEGFRGGDKTSIDLPGVQKRILADLKKTGKPVIFVLCTGSALALEADEKNYDALLCAWYGGQAAGIAVADVLFGDYNPAGRLPITFYKTLSQLDNGLSKHNDPLRQGFENYDMQGRTYRYMQQAPLYPFGHGLSYSTFNYGEAKLSAEIVKGGEGVTITIPVENTSARSGDEVVQVYVKRNGDEQAPVKSLRAFQRVNVEAGQTKRVELKLDSGSFEFYDEAINGLVVKPGSYTVMYGGTSVGSGQKQLDISIE
ncbi:glycoside hydrolase family 3 C-terminal domain-containing protein [Bacteroides sp. 51]|uniref:beta-glucosidase n=1 Tax=Bacteroides sp. 51 TaxID=2302938 RepID=UPI0013CFE0AC|nr:glycoside hydrolase family 3 C-terminal domain-containing protein [Bacteroides sp. 51]NDV81609.1 glycosyl hydrolase [Bacteroides sp. 51]